MSADGYNIIEASIFFHLLWSNPFQIGISIYMLYEILGVSVFVGMSNIYFQTIKFVEFVAPFNKGMGVLAVLFPFNILVWRGLDIYQVAQMEKKDQRVKLITEILSSIKVIKLFAWEGSFIKRVNALRNQEVKYVRVKQLLDGALNLLWISIPILVTMASFFAFVLLDPDNNILDTQTAFVSLALFNVMNMPLCNLPYTISFIVQGRVSLKRMNEFFNLAEMDKNTVRLKDIE